MYQCKAADGSITFADRACRQGEVRRIEAPRLPAVGWTATAADYKVGKPPSARKTRRSKKPAESGKAQRAQEKACWKKRQRLKRINRERRKGYKPARGEKLRQQRRDVEAYLREFCR